MPVDVRKSQRAAVDQTLKALKTGPEHAAVVRLAEKYADVIDSHQDTAWAMRWIGPLLLDCLVTLGATPEADKRTRPGSATNAPKSNRLAQLRANRDAG